MDNQKFLVDDICLIVSILHEVTHANQNPFSSYVS